MSWLMPAELIPIVGVMALVFAWPRISKPTSHVRLVGDVLIIGVGTCAACAAT